MKRTRGAADGELHVMVDIETLDTGPRAKILSIGAHVFDPWRAARAEQGRVEEEEEEEEEGKEVEPLPKTDGLSALAFYAVLDASSYDDAPAGAFTESAATRRWWQERPAAVRDEVLANPAAKPWREALQSFADWMAALPNSRLSVWANSPSFDCVILENAFRQAAGTGGGGGPPWAYYMLRDVRTLGFLCGTTFAQFCKARRLGRRVKQRQQHHALQDCILQVAFVQDALRMMQVARPK